MGRHFQFVNPLWWVLIPGAFIVISLFAFYPDVMPFGHFLSKYQTLLIIVLWGTVIAHAIEAFFARRICLQLRMESQPTLLWMIQTFILGFPSLKMLRGLARHRQ